MQKPKPSRDDSTTDPKSPPSSPHHPPTGDDALTFINPTTEGAEEGASGETLKTPSQVVQELTGDLVGGEDGGGIGLFQGGPTVAVALGLGVGGSSTQVVMSSSELGGGGGGVGSGQKRKASHVKDPPSGTPTCPVCHREFPSWKAAFGHMRKHPDRQYRGFFKPPVFSSPSPTLTIREPQPQPHDVHDQGDGGSGGESSEEQNMGERGSSSGSPTRRGLLIDLNQPNDQGAAESSSANEQVPAPVEQEENKLGFDLNEIPPAPQDDE